ncbi:MAG: hypothetical protein ACOX7P_05355 [Oscillospiraceae bacterium]|jgi:hypothetical protein
MARYVNWYWDGWKMKTVLNEKGRKKRIFVYEGEYYSFNLAPRSLMLLKAIYLILTAALFTVFILSSIVGAPSGEAFYSGGPAMLTIIPFIYLFMGVFSLIPVKEKMTYRSYYASMKRIKYSTRFAIAFLAASVIGQIVFLALNRLNGQLWPELWRLFGSLFCIAVLGAMFYLRHRFPANMINSSE